MIKIKPAVLKVKTFIRNASGYGKIKRERKKALLSASTLENVDNIKQINEIIHPKCLIGTLVGFKKLNNNVKEYTVKLNKPVYYEAGTCCNLIINIDGKTYTRPYSVITEPSEAYQKQEIKIAVKYNKDGIVSKYLFEKADVGLKVRLVINIGHLKLIPVIDQKNIIMVAGGIGITPFLSIIKYIRKERPDYNVKLLYAVREKEDLIYKDVLDKMVDNKFRIEYFVGDFIDIDSLKQEEKTTYLICGSIGLNMYIRRMLSSLNIFEGLIRSEAFTPIKVEENNETVEITVLQGLKETTILGSKDKTIAETLEDCGLKIKTGCRSGFCGHCRIKLIEGEVINKTPVESRRYTDIENNYIYACVNYPKTNLKIKINC